MKLEAFARGEPLFVGQVEARSEWGPGYFDLLDGTGKAYIRVGDLQDRGCTGEISNKKIFSNPFFSHCNLIDMVCRMNIHQGRF